MAETLTFENTTEVTSADNLNADEQDSLKVGEAIQEEQESLLAGKYKDAQELESAYIELQKKLGDKGSEASEETGDTKDSKEEESEKETEETKKDTEEDNILDKLWDQSGNDKYDEATLEQLSKTDPAELAKMHLEFRAEVEKYAPKEISDEDAKQIRSIAGTDDQYNEMLQWAGKNLSEQEISMFDTVMERGDPLAAFFAVRALTYRWEDSRGVDGRMLTGTAPKTSGSQFRSQAEVVQAMSDPRYEKDSAYRADVMKKLERSDVNF
tara:strand:+ start:1363 stop:2166 length:804 start_codon:yes stop_codon:yes gene_type:complete